MILARALQHFHLRLTEDTVGTTTSKHYSRLICACAHTPITMRVRLTVQRHNLPPSNIIWTIPDTASPQAYTVARLLEDVNRIIPLEAEQWGLEDYVVEVGGFECLHFSPVSQTLKEEDIVS